MQSKLLGARIFSFLDEAGIRYPSFARRLYLVVELQEFLPPLLVSDFVLDSLCFRHIAFRLSCVSLILGVIGFWSRHSCRVISAVNIFFGFRLTVFDESSA